MENLGVDTWHYTSTMLMVILTNSKIYWLSLGVRLNITDNCECINFLVSLN